MPDAPAPRVTTKIVVPGAHSMVSLLGSRDELLAVIEKALTSDVHVRGNEITLTGAAADNALAETLFSQLLALLDAGQTLTGDAVERTVAMLSSAGTRDTPADVLSLAVLAGRGRTIRPKTVNQKRYVEAIDDHTITFGIGPAGTGKTYLAMAKAVQALQAKQVKRIILTRPAVEAGERLGFLPGTLFEKIDPYLRPLYDALHDMLDPETIPKLMAAGTIEVAPLAYMRGRAQPVDTLVLTPEGAVPIGSLEVGDLVVGSDGRPTPVLGVYPQGRKEVFRVTAQDGASHAGVRGAPLAGAHRGGPPPGPCRAGPGDPRDAWSAARRARPAFRAPRRGAGPDGPVRGADGPVRPRPAAGRRLHHGPHHAVVQHPRPRARPRPGGGAPRDRARAEGPGRLRAAPRGATTAAVC